MVKTVTMHTSTQDTRWVTLAVAVCADGAKLPPALIFKGKENTRIVVKEFPMFPTDCEHYCQENAWMDEGAMLDWVGKILNHLLQQHQKMLFHCSCWILTQCHMMALVASLIHQLGVEVEHISGGYT